ncbi:unnamed protein product [Discula destructiva]
MGLAENVSALLETYDNCVSLLKAFKKQRKQDGGHRVSKVDERQALLRRSLKADRKKIHRAYASRVSETGSLFEKGDTKSRSALTRVLKRLNAVIAGLIRVASKGSSPAMDYQSLMSLSHSSRLQAIKAFDQLSHRLESKSSRSSIVSTVPSKQSKSSKVSKPSKASTSSNSKNTSASTPNKKVSKSPPQPPTPRTETPPPPKYDIRRKPLPQSISQTPPPRYSSVRHKALPPLPETTIQTPLLDSIDFSRRMEDDLGLSLRRRPSMMDRFSLMTMSSGSTKLGEIPERKWHHGYDDWGGRADEYSAPVVYPLRPYQPVVKERRFLGLFRRGTS